MKIKENHITVDGSTIQYKSIGAGVAVVFLHGFAEDSSIWDAQISFLQDDFFCIIPDLPGSGGSQLLQKENVCLEDYAYCIRQILQHEGITQCIMIGHSMGGYITLAFAEQYPGQLKAFGLFHSSSYADDTDKIATRQKAISFIDANGVQAFLKTSIPGLFYDAEKSQVDIERLLAKGKAFTAEALIQYYKAMIARPDRTNVLKKTFPFPVLFIMGMHDKAVPIQHSLQQSHIPCQTYIYILRNSAHMGMLEETAKSNESLKEFLQSC